MYPVHMVLYMVEHLRIYILLSYWNDSNKRYHLNRMILKYSSYQNLNQNCNCTVWHFRMNYSVVLTHRPPNLSVGGRFAHGYWMILPVWKLIPRCIHWRCVPLPYIHVFPSRLHHSLRSHISPLRKKKSSK